MSLRRKLPVLALATAAVALVVAGMLLPPSASTPRYGSIGSPAIVFPPSAATDVTDVYNAITACGADPTGGVDARAGLQACIDAASVTGTATGRDITVLLPGGTYCFTKKPSSLYSLDLSGRQHVVLAGPRTGPRRAKMKKCGSAGAGEWRLVNIGPGAAHIRVEGIIFDGSGETNADPAEQAHLVNVGGSTLGVDDVVIRDNEFLDPIGDGIRLIGEFGSWTQNVEITGNRFFRNQRAAISFQRFTRHVHVFGNYLSGGTDQQIDFEPTGYVLTMASTGSSTVAVCDGSLITGSATVHSTNCNFPAWGFAVGDLIMNRLTNELVYIVSIDSNTQITTTPLSGAGTWASTSVSTTVGLAPQNVTDIEIDGNLFDYSGHLTSGVEICLSVKDEQRVSIHNNLLAGCSIGGIDGYQMSIANNVIFTGARGGAEAAISIQGYGGENKIVNNTIIARQLNGSTVAKNGITVAIDTPAFPSSTLIAGNTIRMEAPGNGIDVEDTPYFNISGNAIVKANNGSTGQPTAIQVRAPNVDIQSALIDGNRMRADNTAQGIKWTNCIQLAAAPKNVVSSVIANNIGDNCTNGINLAETSPGRFTNPPLIGPNVMISTSPLGLPASALFVQLAGIGGPNATSSLVGCILSGTADPNVAGTGGTKPKCPEGSLYLRKGGGAGARVYVNTDGTSAWTALAAP
jgi:hypothetical protein